MASGLVVYIAPSSLYSCIGVLRWGAAPRVDRRETKSRMAIYAIRFFCQWMIAANDGGDYLLGFKSRSRRWTASRR